MPPIWCKGRSGASAPVAWGKHGGRRAAPGVPSQGVTITVWG